MSIALRPVMETRATHWWRLPEKLRFLAAGAYNTAFGYAAFGALYGLLTPRVNIEPAGRRHYGIFRRSLRPYPLRTPPSES